VGNLCAPFELHTPAEGKPFARARLIVETPMAAGAWRGEKQTSVYDVVCFGSLAEHAAASLAKGMRVVVLGHSDVRTWTGRDGTEHSSEDIVADAIGPDLRYSNFVVVPPLRKEPGAPVGSNDTALPGWRSEE
jgi:single-strand DNA-binding protein